MRIQDRINKTQGMIDVGWCVGEKGRDELTRRQVDVGALRSQHMYRSASIKEALSTR